MAKNDKRPLFAIIIFLVISLVALLTLFAIFRLKDKGPEIILKPEELRQSENPEVPESDNSESENPEKSESSTQKNFEKSKIPISSVPLNVCKSPECITLSEQLINWQDPSVDPCQDFYKSTCGKYIEHSVVPSRMDKKSKIVQQLIEEFFASNKKSNLKSDISMKVLHQKCVDWKEDFERSKLQGLKKVFEDIRKIGSSPLFDDKWNERNFDLNEFLSKMAEFGITNFGIFEIKFSPKQYLQIMPVDQPIPFEDEIVQTISEIRTAHNLSVNQNKMDKISEDHEKLSEVLKAVSEEEKTLQVEYSELKNALPKIDFDRILGKLINPKKKLKMWRKLENRIRSYKFNIFFDKKQNLEHILKATPKGTIANFLIVHFLNFAMDTLSEYGIDSKNCAAEVMRRLPRAALRVFVENHFDKNNLKIVGKMINETKESFVDMLKESTWLHEETRKNAILKVRKMDFMVGYTEQFEKKGEMERIFGNLNLSYRDSFYEVDLKIRRFLTEQYMDFAALELSMDPKIDLLVTNAFYEPDTNLMAILVPFLDEPLFDSTFPKYAQIAGIGGTIAHEMGHGFDTDGRFTNENGLQKNFWNSEDSKEYDKRAQCMIEQYDNYDDPDFGKNLIGKNTINEMVADNVRMEVSWREIKKLNLSKESEIVGFEGFDKRKLFFRIMALNFCSHRDTSSMLDMALRSHPTSSFRVNGVFSNTKTFGETFNCPVGSPMNPSKKCELFGN